MATANNKDTIYIDIDDEITAIIEKVRSSAGKVIALVLPKRASVLQSIVNMKLLKRAADDGKKHLVLITTEAGLLPLAGAVGMYVAKTLTSKPEVPVPPQLDDGSEENVNEDDSVATPLDSSSTVGELAGLGAATEVGADGVETVQLDDDGDEAAAAGAPLATKTFEPKNAGAKKNSKLRVPNFERFRLLLILGVLLIILLGFGLFYALSVMPKATIAIKTDATNINANLNLTLDTQKTALDAASNTIPAKLVQQSKTYTQSNPATGQKNNGDKAKGTVTISMNGCTKDSVTIPKGTGVSTNGLTYITQATANLSSVTVGGKCNPSAFSNVYSQTVDALASTGGTNYNISSGVTMTVASGSDYKSSDLKATSAADFTGGTDSITKVVSQTDIDNAKAKITTTDPTVKDALKNQLGGAGYYAVDVTFAAGTPTTTNSANVGDSTDTVTVTETVVYTLFGVHQSDLKTLVDNNVQKQIDTKKQSILTEGLSSATFNVSNATATTAQISMSTVATAGPDLNVDQLKKDFAGKKPGEIKASLQSNPDVTGVDVKLSPFWVTSVPKKTSKITVTIAKPTAAVTKSSDASSNP